ncbi:hypothetical protein [Methanogenium sp. MK-MG]|uniref:hypothetical protein n=1 Tax=Methanogenium sp. MK-MG TaxID=2599926 RepID=UPI0013EAC113|nr:hypothetical protein [Methanogenium sp. MK-MG]KAF1077250.1 hypothetical protein MKMG_01291 [Methanogenium sp. MK-MG]
MEWIITLSGEEHRLKELSKVFDTLDFCIQEDNSSYVLKSERFMDLSTEQEVREQAEYLLQLLRGPSKLVLGNGSAIKICHITQVHDDGTKHYYVRATSISSSTTSIKVETINPDGTVEEYHPADPVRNWIILSQKDRAVKMMFEQLSDDFENWYGLYKLFEIIREDVRNIPKKGWCTPRELNRFTQTANSHEAVGVKARHAKKIPAPPDPMSLPQAKILVKKMITEWLQEKSIQYGL